MGGLDVLRGELVGVVVVGALADRGQPAVDGRREAAGLVGVERRDDRLASLAVLAGPALDLAVPLGRVAEHPADE
jgi:hypothetical protein